MFVLAPIVIVAAVLVVLAVRARQGKPISLHGRWKRAARQLGLDFSIGSRGPRMRGVIDEMQVGVGTFVREHRGRRKRFTRVVVDFGQRLREAEPQRQKGETEDQAVRRLLRRNTDRRILQLVKQVGATVGHGRIKWVRPEVNWEVEDLVDAVNRLVRTAGLFVQDGGSVPDRLLANVQDLSVPDEERLGMAQVLFERFRGSTQARKAAEGLVEHPQPAIRLKAARVLGESGAGTLGKLLRDQTLPRSVREDALDALLKDLAPRVWEPVLARSLHSPHEEVVRTILRRIQLLNHRAAHSLLRRVASDGSMSPRSLSALARTLGRIGDRSAGPILLKMLEHADPGVQREAAIALAYKGGPDDVKPLLSRLSYLPEGRIRNLCRTAVREIEARHGVHALRAG